MRQALDLLQFLLWAEGFLCLVAAPALARAAWVNPSTSLLSWATVYMGILGLAAPWIAWGLSRRERWSRWAGLAHGVLQVPALPFFTPIGVVALLALAHPASGRHLTEEPPPAGYQRFPLWRLGLYLAGLGWLIGAAWWAGHAAHQYDAPLWTPAQLLLLAPLLAALDVVVHELGHLGAGALAGLRFERFCAGPLLVRRLGDGWGVSFHPSLLLEGGFVSMLPQRLRGLRASLALMAAGGPVASLALAAGAALAALQWTAWLQPLMLLAAWSLFTFLGNLWPARSGGGTTDGALLLDLLGSTPAGQRYCAMAAMALSETTSLRPRDWKPEWLERARQGVPGSPEHLSACLLEHVHHLDRGNRRRAAEVLEEALGLQRRLPDLLVTRQVRLAEAWFEAIERNDPDRARDALDAARTGLPVERYARLRVEAAVLSAEEDACCAGLCLGAAEQALRRARPTGMAAWEHDRLEETRARLPLEVAACAHDARS